jgi:hypothetical protein
MPAVILLNAIISNAILLNVNMLNGILLNVIYAECRGASSTASMAPGIFVHYID